MLDPITRRRLPEPVLTALAARFGDRFSRTEAMRRQHSNIFTWYENQPPDAVVFATTTEDVQEVVRLCATHRVPLIPFGTGTSLEGHLNAPFGGISIDLARMDAILAVHTEDLDCSVEPGVTRSKLNSFIRA